MISTAGVITGVRVSHDVATVDEIAAASGADQRSVVNDLRRRDGVEEALSLLTCNRAEAYVVTSDAAAGRAALDDFAPAVREEAVVRMDHEESIRHLMRVASGLESLVVGEDQILGQVRTAYEDARAEGGIGTMLDDAVLKALHVGEQVRTETAINEGVVSLGSAAVELASDHVDLADATALVVGAGEMATLAARSLADSGVSRVVVANRTVPHAEHVANEIPADARAVALPAAPSAAERADVVVTATAGEDHVLSVTDLRAAGDTVVVDLAQPRDVEPGADGVDDVVVFDLDALEDLTDDTREQRQAAAREAEAIIDREFDHLLEQYKRKRADDVIAGMYESAERVKSRELSQALSQMEAAGDLSEEQRAVVESLADSLVSQLLAAPTRSLRDAAAEDDWSTINTALQLFDPAFGDDPPAFVEGMGATDGRPAELPDGIPESVAEDLPDDVPPAALRALQDDD